MFVGPRCTGHCTHCEHIAHCTCTHSCAKKHAVCAAGPGSSPAGSPLCQAATPGKGCSLGRRPCSALQRESADGSHHPVSSRTSHRPAAGWIRQGDAHAAPAFSSQVSSPASLCSLSPHRGTCSSPSLIHQGALREAPSPGAVLAGERPATAKQCNHCLGCRFPPGRPCAAVLWGREVRGS